MSKVFTLIGSGNKGDIVKLNKNKNCVKIAQTKPKFEDVIRINSNNKTSGECSVSDLDGNIYIVGQFDKDAFSENILLTNIGEDTSGIFIAQLGRDGGWKWGRKIIEYDGAIDINADFDIIFNKGNLYAAGVVVNSFVATITADTDIEPDNNPSGFVVKFDQGGNIEYLTTFDGTLGQRIRLSVDGKENIYYVNSYQGRLKLSKTIELPDIMNTSSMQKNTAYIAKLDKKGEFVWARDLSIPDNENNTSILNDIVTTKKGRSFVVGSFTGKIKLDDKILKCGHKNTYSYDSSEYYSHSYDTSDTSSNWKTCSDSSLYSDSYSKCCRKKNKEILNCFLLAEIDKHGCWVRERHFKKGEGLGVDLDFCNNLIISGIFEETFELGKKWIKNNKGTSLFVAKLDKNFQLEWFFDMKYNVDTVISANITLDEWDNVYVDGPFGAPLKFPNDILIPKNVVDKYLFKLSSDGCFEWVVHLIGVQESVSKEVSIDPFGNIYIATGFDSFITVDHKTVAYTFFETLAVIKIGQKFPKLLGVIVKVLEEERICDTCSLSLCSCSESNCSINMENIMHEDSKVEVAFKGIIDAFECLKPGKDYYLDLDGCLTLDDGFPYFGTALSCTELQH